MGWFSGEYPLDPSLIPTLPLTHIYLDDSEQAQAYNTYNGQEEHDPSVIHELIAGAASYEAAKAYENHVAENGTYTIPPLPSFDDPIHKAKSRDRKANTSSYL